MPNYKQKDYSQQDHDHQGHDHNDESSLDDFIQSALPRRRLLGLLGLTALSGSALAACGGGGSGSGSTTTTVSVSSSSSASTSSSSSSSASSSSSSSASGTCTTLPEETAGPYPGDGSNTLSGSVVNVLNISGIVRSDIRTSVGAYSGTAEGVQLTLTITLVNTNTGCTPLAGYAIYLWHCTRDGNYSLYTVANQNYLRGVLVTDNNGQVTFTTIVPGCYSGRMPHMHVEVYPSLASATSYTNKIKTTQFALERAFCATLYASATGYSASVSNLNNITFATDNVFSDDTAAQLAASTMTPAGTIAAGYAASINLGIAV
ncbi:dioxygenase family protein [Asticcacaulis biprosthecium C19]|uniref:Dioxygenase family protein n=1 Tax=Asticcacaulis biprosthecium C19 TaxID=715226 RepID=F4QNF1_9CAUL|nr:intradiol ring-cleavage dioxygenase [Asticcacaulis biprosthecium]EGF90859.1 dioxygenase family protein [Asticcacaulis biprosthecium C19]